MTNKSKAKFYNFIVPSHQALWCEVSSSVMISWTFPCLNTRGHPDRGLFIFSVLKCVCPVQSLSCSCLCSPVPRVLLITLPVYTCCLSYVFCWVLDVLQCLFRMFSVLCFLVFLYCILFCILVTQFFSPSVFLDRWIWISVSTKAPVFDK